MHWEAPKFVWLTLLQYSLYSGLSGTRPTIFLWYGCIYKTLQKYNQGGCYFPILLGFESEGKCWNWDI